MIIHLLSPDKAELEIPGNQNKVDDPMENKNSDQRLVSFIYLF